MVATGTWSDVKVTQGAKFTKSIYAMAKTGSEDYELINFQVKGAALTAWIEFVDSVMVTAVYTTTRLLPSRKQPTRRRVL